MIRVDYDGLLPHDLYARIRFVADVLKRRVRWWTVRRTRRGWHLEVAESPALNPVATVAAQAILGSDPRREAFNLARALVVPHVPKMWRDRFNVLYVRKIQGRKRAARRERGGFSPRLER